MTQTIGDQIWSEAVAKLHVPDPSDFAAYVGEVMEQLRRHIVDAVNQLDASYRADLDATEEHYRHG